MASVMFLSKNLNCAPLALKLAEDGHLVKIFTKEARLQGCLKGCKNPSVTDSWRNFKQYDLICADTAGLGEIADEIKGGNGLVLGGGVFNDRLELDKVYSERVISSICKLTPYTPQECTKGIEISTEGWFNGESFIHYNHSIKQKRLLDGDIGPEIECMGNVVWVTEGDRLTETVLNPLTPLLKKVDYLGPLSVDCIINEDKISFLSFTTRFSYDAMQALNELMNMSLFDFLYRTATQQGSLSFKKEIAIAVRMVMLPYLKTVRQEELHSLRIFDIPQEAKKHVWLGDIYKNKDNYLINGAGDVIGCVTARGMSSHECRRRAYRTLNNILLSKEVIYRRDIGSKAEAQVKSLRGGGWLN